MNKNRIMILADYDKIPYSKKLISVNEEAFEAREVDPKKLQAKFEDVIIGDYVEALQAQGINEFILVQDGSFKRCRI